MSSGRCDVASSSPRPGLQACKDLARQRIESGRLPRHSGGAVSAGYGPPMPCALCGHTIDGSDLRYEVLSERARALYRRSFHVACFLGWEAVSLEERRAGVAI